MKYRLQDELDKIHRCVIVVIEYDIPHTRTFRLYFILFEEIESRFPDGFITCSRTPKIFRRLWPSFGALRGRARAGEEKARVSVAFGVVVAAGFWRRRLKLPWIAQTKGALPPGATAVWDEVSDNVLVDTLFGDAAATESAFAIADHIVEMEFHVARVTGAPMEPRAALGHWDAATGRGTLWAGSGGAVRQKIELAEVLGVPPDRVRVVSLDVGGNFGTRNRLYVESGLVLWASHKLGRPVKYTSTRSEVFLTDFQGRDLLTRVALAIRADGKFLGLRADNVSNVGARCASLSPLGKGSALVTGSYDIPAATLRSRAVFTNTMSTNAYRRSRRPEVPYEIVRVVDEAARRLDIDRVALRRANLVGQEAMPYPNAVGARYDSGTYEANMDLAVEIADWD